jgi:allophanate hydrolase
LADGAIQVPGSGLPIVLLVDRQTVGGYPKIAVVASVDVGRFAWLGPGDAIRFSEISVDDAEQALIAREQHVAELVSNMIEARSPGTIDVAALWTVNIAGKAVNALEVD